MTGFLTVLALAAMPAAGNFFGGLLAEAINVSQRTLSLALHAAAGIVFAVIGVELVPEALANAPAWLVMGAVMAGGGAFLLLDAGIGYVRERFGGKGGSGSEWAIFFGVCVDLFSDGLMIGTGTSVSLSLGLLLAVGQVTADVPEGFATIATFKRKGVRRSERLLLSAAFAIPVLLGATAGYWLLRDQSEAVQWTALAFTAGVLLTVTVEEIVPEAHADGEARTAALFLVGGFALFGLVSAYLG